MYFASLHLQGGLGERSAHSKVGREEERGACTPTAHLANRQIGVNYLQI